MPSQIVVVASTIGLHARPVSLLVKAAGGAGLATTIGRPGEKAANAASMLAVMALGAKHGEELEITVAEGPNADSILEELVNIVATNHDE